MPLSYHSLHRLDTRLLFSWKGRHLSHFFGHISETGSRRHIYFKLNLWTHCSFQMSPKLSKSIEPSPRKKCEFEKSRHKNHISGYSSETGSLRHNPFKLDRWHHKGFQMSSNLLKSVQSSLKNMSR